MDTHVSQTDPTALLDTHYFRDSDPRPLTEAECRFIRHKATGLHRRCGGALGALLIGILKEADVDRRDNVLQLVSRCIRVGEGAAA